MMNERRVLRNIARLGIEWHFNAPASSHAGGVWERLIRSVRKVLTALADDRHLFFRRPQIMICGRTLNMSKLF